VDFVRQIRVRLPQCLKISSLSFFQATQSLNPAFLGTVKSIRAPARTVILIRFFFKVHPSSWWLNLFLLGWHRSQTPENRDPLCISLPGSALRAVLGSRQSTHAGIPTILEERAMPMITRVFPFLQTFSSMMFILFLL
jgi:hypothetical protein